MATFFGAIQFMLMLPVIGLMVTIYISLRTEINVNPKLRTLSETNSVVAFYLACAILIYMLFSINTISYIYCWVALAVVFVSTLTIDSLLASAKKSEQLVAEVVRERKVQYENSKPYTNAEMYEAMRERQQKAAKQAEADDKLRATFDPLKRRLIRDAQLPKVLKSILTEILLKYGPDEGKPQKAADQIPRYVKGLENHALMLPPHELIALGAGRAWKDYTSEYWKTHDMPDWGPNSERNLDEWYDAKYGIGNMSNHVMAIEMSISIPDRLRTEHHMIVAGSGHGKTQCIQQMLLEDLETDAPIIVLDSQEGMIECLTSALMGPIRVIC